MSQDNHGKKNKAKMIIDLVFAVGAISYVSYFIYFLIGLIVLDKEVDQFAVDYLLFPFVLLLACYTAWIVRKAFRKWKGNRRDL